MARVWLKERGSDPACFCPLETEEGMPRVVVGLTIITDKPPGEVVGEFWYEDDAIEVKFYKETLTH